ncbi:MAG: excinuclease ABC subunit UvrC [Treponema berlinense]|uniref:excinuclease ABC subunit UvrC n=1 Tax=Treponema berlinense TaxID=225004 RepID=UPI0023F3748A|nr:excinuclease ABC subunit UvrC [Treponema berlinense]MDD5834762.1 excinuclease ABC subunit UvrC [Treponema berlinense]
MNTSVNPAYEILHETALKAPSSSGVYLWRNEKGTVIYVGKAKNLKNRLSSYFSGERHIKVQLLVSNASSIEYITTSNEYEAFLLENNLIKKYSPRYNIQLKDGKSYPSLKITNEEFPRLFKTRQIKKDGSIYYGPYPDSGALETFIETLYKVYPVRHCRTFKKRTAPCMYYHIGRCKAPCCGKIDKDSYNEFIEEIKSLLEGKGDETVAKMTSIMKAAAASLNFEKAARIRDGLRALTVMQNQNLVEDFVSMDDRDYISHWREGELVSFTVLKIRGGKLLGRDNFRVESIADDDELLEEFAAAYYSDGEDLPPSVFVSEEDNSKILGEWLENLKPDEEHSQKQKTKLVTVKCSQDDRRFSAENRRHAAILNMAKNNAHEDIIRRLRERGDMPALEELKKLLGLPRLPDRIEGFDIAHIGGKFPVASLISFWKGNPDKKNYRYFRLKTTDGVIDDFASMREAATRRYSRLKNENESLPDLILIDGGIGQVNAVDGILKALDLDIPIAGLAKRDEEIWRPHASKPICLPKRSDALRLLQRVRDETHRFATSRNQTLRTKENTVSIFSTLPHVGEKREKLLLKTFTTIENLAKTEESQIAQLLHIRADEAGEILLSAKNLAQQRKEAKKSKKMVLNRGLNDENYSSAGEENSYTKALASAALDLKVAEP